SGTCGTPFSLGGVRDGTRLAPRAWVECSVARARMHARQPKNCRASEKTQKGASFSRNDASKPVKQELSFHFTDEEPSNHAIRFPSLQARGCVRGTAHREGESESDRGETNDGEQVAAEGLPARQRAQRLPVLRAARDEGRRVRERAHLRHGLLHA